MKSLSLPLFAVSGFLLPLSAQEAAETPPKDEGTVIELSPFTVTAEDDDGYASTVVTSGSRLRTNLGDVAASISVVTSDLLDDLAATDVASAVAFLSGAENDKTTHQEAVAELGGNNLYVGGDFGDNNNRSGEVRVRGLGRATTTVDFIEVLGSTDRYNIERSEFLRGANSILFGLAEPAGLVNLTTKMAKVGKDSNRVELRVDEFGSHRAVMDFNRVIAQDRLAVRVIGLYEDTRYEVDTAFERDKRITATTTWRPFAGTTVRATYEMAETRGRRPNYRMPQDNVSEWLAAYNEYAPQMTPAQVEAAFFWNPLAPSATGVAPSSTFTLSDGRAVDLGLIRRPLDTSATPTALIYSGNGDWTNPLGGVVTNLANRWVNGSLATPNSARTQFLRTGSSIERAAGLVTNPQVTDPGIFPYETVELGALPGNYRWERDDRLFLGLEQRVTRDFYISANFQREVRDQEQHFAVISQTNQISLDINRNLPDGRANPNFLRPFIYGRSLGENNNAVATTGIVQANYDLDFSEKTERFGWLGMHRFTALFNTAEVDKLGYRWNYRFNNDVPVALPSSGTVGGVNAQQRWAMQLWYVGDPVQLGDTALRFTGFPDTLTAHWDRQYDYLFFNNTVNPRAWQTASQKIQVGRNPISGGRSYTVQDNSGLGLSLQSYFWDKRIITLLGWRRDQVENLQGIPRPDTDFVWPVVAATSRSDYLPQGTVFENEEDTTTQSVIFRATPWLRLFANRSENFAATTPRQDNLYRQIAPQSGDTEEFGFGLSLLRGKLDIKTTFFKSAQEGATNSTGVAGLRIVAFEDTLYNALDAAGRLSEWTTIDQTGVPTTDRYERPNNAASTQDVVSEGVAVEFTFKPSRNWEFIGSVDKLENTLTNVGTEIGDFLAYRADFYRKYFQEGLRVDGTTVPVSSSQRLQDNFITSIANNYINEINKEGTSNRGLSEYTARLVGRYRFTAGPMRGFTVGGTLRWESGKVLGYAQKDAVFNFGGLDNVPGRVADTSVQYEGGHEWSGGILVGYSRKVFDDKVRWRIQLNIDNIFTKDSLRVIAANADGSPVYAINQPRTFVLSNTFDF